MWSWLARWRDARFRVQMRKRAQTLLPVIEKEAEICSNIIASNWIELSYDLKKGHVKSIDHMISAHINVAIAEIHRNSKHISVGIPLLLNPFFYEIVWVSILKSNVVGGPEILEALKRREAEYKDRGFENALDVEEFTLKMHGLKPLT